MRTPKGSGYRMPAEWEEHQATWLVWPHNRRMDYWGSRLVGVEDIFVQIIAGLQDSEEIKLIVVDSEMEKYVKGKLHSQRVGSDQVSFYEIPTLDVWIRDYGPLFVRKNSKNKSMALTHWIFNGWGKYHDLIADTSVPAKIHELSFSDFSYYHAGLVLEGGSVEVNGKGLLLTTEQCLLNHNRNPYHSREDIETKLRDYLGVEKIIWLKKGLVGDDTDGHIDNLARFVSPQLVVCLQEENRQDRNYRRLQENRRILCSLQPERSIDELISLPTPGRVEIDGKRAPASYANFYIANTAVLVPVFGVERDKTAVGILSDIFPQRKIVPINCLDLIPSGGTIHCVTQQEPKWRQNTLQLGW